MTPLANKVQQITWHLCVHVSEARIYLVVIGKLLPSMYVMLGVDNNVLLTVHGDDLGIAVGVAAVIDEARKTTLRHVCSALFGEGLKHAKAIPASHISCKNRLRAITQHSQQARWRHMRLLCSCSLMVCAHRNGCKSQQQQAFGLSGKAIPAKWDRVQKDSCMQG